MTYQTLSQLLLLFLMAVACARVLFLSSAREDSLSALPAVTLLLAVLHAVAFGVGIFSQLLLILAACIFIWNVRAMLRFRARLVVDHYSPAFILVSLLNLVLVALLAVAVVRLRPVRVSLGKFGVEKATEAYAGSLSGGFAPATRPFARKSLIVRTYRPAAGQEGRGTVVFVPSECADTETYEPFLVKLAHDGFTVVAGDFFAPDAVWFGMPLDLRFVRTQAFCHARIARPEAYAAAAAHREENLPREFAALLSLLPGEEDGFVYVVGDEGGGSARTWLTAGARADGVFDLSSIESYTTKGYGPVEQTNPVLARVLGYDRDATLYTASHVASVLERTIRDQQMMLRETQGAGDADDAE